jgi:ParB family transcriptional regulator, chromosome partitioning protein
MLCGRPAGQLIDGRFAPDGRVARPVRTGRGSRCGACGGGLLVEEGQTISPWLATQPTSVPPRAVRSAASETRPASATVSPTVQQAAARPRAAWLPVDMIAETPGAHDSRRRGDDPTLDELAASIRQHGILQPLLVRPLTVSERAEDGQEHRPSYVVIAGNRRLRAARLAGLREVPCTIRIADADAAFVLNVVENLQRRELSGRERVRAIAILAGLTDGQQRPLSVREISRRTGLATGTISMWLRLDRRPALRAALEAERLDIGRAMKLVPAPEEALPELIERAGSVTREQLVKEVAAMRRDPQIVADRSATANFRRAMAAEACVKSIDNLEGPVREVIIRLRQQLDALLASRSYDAPAPHAAQP